MWLLLLKFLAAHFLGDFVFQTKKMVQNKHKLVYFASHIAIHAVLMCLFLANDTMWWAIILVTIFHALFDWIKLKLASKIKAPVLFIADQVVHIATIIVVLMIFSSLEISIDFINKPHIWLVLVAVVLVTQVTAVLIRILLSPYQQYKKVQEHSVQITGEKVLFNAGKYIGILERLFIFGFVIANFWAGIGFLLAAKSIFRFGDLNNAKERHLTEYVLIGTFLSFGCAIVVGLIFNYVLHHLI
jgi:hypothetical protein